MTTASLLQEWHDPSVNKSEYMMASSSTSSSFSDHPGLYHIVDELYFSALHDDDEVFPISDEKYAEELQLQEALIHSSSISSTNENESSTPSDSPTPDESSSSSSSLVLLKNKEPLVEEQKAIDEVFPISDEKYAEELQLQESLIHSSSISSTNENEFSTPSDSPTPDESSSSSSLVLLKNKEPLVESKIICQELVPVIYCGICMDSKTESEMFRNTNVCGHMFCTDCICEYVAARIKENLAIVKCPDPSCKGVIGPEVCQTMVPKQVLERWEEALCESLIMGSEKFYCPFKDCSAMLVDDGGVAVTSSECPNCNRLFCAQCRVAWHCGMDCGEYKSLKTGERDPDDLMLMDLAKNKKWMRCPSCKFYVERTSGCSHISCRCGHHFCYECGKQNNGTSHTCAHY